MTISLSLGSVQSSTRFRVLELEAQARTAARATRISVNLPLGYEYASSKTTPSLILAGKVEFGFNLITDTVLELELAKVGPCG